MFSPTVDELALKKKTLLPVYPSQVLEGGVAPGIRGFCTQDARRSPDTGRTAAGYRGIGGSLGPGRGPVGSLGPRVGALGPDARLWRALRSSL